MDEFHEKLLRRIKELDDLMEVSLENYKQALNSQIECVNLLHNKQIPSKEDLKIVTQQSMEGRKLVKRLRVKLDSGNVEGIYDIIGDIDAFFWSIEQISQGIGIKHLDKTL